jgi:hypothetical protein
MNNLKPWVYGLFELIQHSEEHLDIGKDADKRIALIGYDNSIEASITAYLKLHPSQRGGRVYKKEEIAQWLINYHTRLDFFYGYIASFNPALPLKKSKEEIVWYHNLRNELYHSGHGMVPEEYSLKGIREAALWIFSTLFEVDAEALLNKKLSPTASISKNVSVTNNTVTHRPLFQQTVFTSSASNNVTAFSNWRPFSNLDSLNYIPARIKFPDGTIVVTESKGMPVLRAVAEWLVKYNKLPIPPIEGCVGQKYLVKVEPIHHEPKRNHRLANGWHLNTQHTADGCVKNALCLIKKSGENPDDYFFQ